MIMFARFQACCFYDSRYSGNIFGRSFLAAALGVYNGLQAPGRDRWSGGHDSYSLRYLLRFVGYA